MKKICILLSLIFVLMCSGCGPTKKPLLEGTFYSIEVSSKNEDMKDKFSEAKVTIKEITKEEYEEANGVNVLIDGYTSQIEEKLNANQDYKLKEGDIVSVDVKNTNQTLSQQLKNFFYSVVGKDTYTIAASHAGIVTATGK